MIRSIHPVLCVRSVAASRDFYVSLLGLSVVFDSGWFAQLQCAHAPSQQLGLVEFSHPSVPEAHRSLPRGALVTVEVDDVDVVYARAREKGLEIALSLRDEDFGQRHFMTIDPDGLLVDIVKMIAPSKEYEAHYQRSDTR
ncbi:MAG: VOC family protein [Myxococcales bacterium]|nr:VOC family protein [Myxococcales bacterium]